MARLVTYEDSRRPSMDYFGDGPVRDPYETYSKHPTHGDTSTITTAYTSGVLAPQPISPLHLGGQSEAESLAAHYKQASGSSTVQTLVDDAAKQSANRHTYVDEDFNYYPSKPLPTINENQEAPLVHNAADVGRSGNYQDLGEPRVLFRSFELSKYIYGRICRTTR